MRRYAPVHFIFAFSIALYCVFVSFAPAQAVTFTVNSTSDFSLAVPMRIPAMESVPHFQRASVPCGRRLWRPIRQSGVVRRSFCRPEFML